MAYLEHDFLNLPPRFCETSMEKKANKHLVYFEVDIKEKMDLEEEDFVL
jgi:hypothetical protein